MLTVSNLRPEHNRLIVWFPPMAWLASSAVTPLIYYAKLRHEQVEPRQRKILVAQEACRQIASGGIGFLTSAGGVLLGSLLTRKTGAKTLNQVIWSTLAGCFGSAVVRPIVGTDLFIQWMRRKGLMAFQDSAPDSGQRAASTPEARMGGFMRQVQARSETVKLNNWA